MDNAHEPCPRCEVRLGFHPPFDPERPGSDRCREAEVRERALEYQ